MTTIAIMQPYFAPYAGYFRLIEEADIFVVYDCVQFPRRGWVHRNRCTNKEGELSWLTLPLAKQPRSISINQLQFHEIAQELWEERLRKFDHLAVELSVWEQFSILKECPLTSIESWLLFACERLDINAKFIRSSELNIPSEYRGAERIIRIIDALDGDRYINAPNGVELYSQSEFASKGIELDFLNAYQGSFLSIAQRLLTESSMDIREEIKANCFYQNTSTSKSNR